MYYVHAKIRGKILWRSLDTTTFTVAKLRLPNELKKLRDAAPVEVKLETKITFGQAVELYKHQVNENSRLKPRAKEFVSAVSSRFAPLGRTYWIWNYVVSPLRRARCG